VRSHHTDHSAGRRSDSHSRDPRPRTRARERTVSVPELDAVEPFSPLLTDDYLEHHCILPLGVESGRLMVATWRDEVDQQAMDDLRLLAGLPIDLLQLPEPDLRAAIRRIYAPESLTAEDLIANLSAETHLGEGD